MLTQTFSISRDEVVSGDYFSHTNEPMLTVNPAKKIIYINAAVLKRLPEMKYALLLISPAEKRLSVFPCDSGERHAVRLRTMGKSGDKPRQVRCREEFWDNILSLTGWKSDSRYRLIGYMAKSKVDTIIVFDLSSAEVFSPGERISHIPENVSEGFGEAFENLLRHPLIKMAENDIEISLGTEGETLHEN